MIENQLGRRNLTDNQLSYHKVLIFFRRKTNKGEYQNVESKGQNEPLTSEKLDEEFGFSGSTIKRDRKFAKGLNILGELRKTGVLFTQKQAFATHFPALIFHFSTFPNLLSITICRRGSASIWPYQRRCAGKPLEFR